MSSLSRQFNVLICFFFCLICSFLAEAQINPCDPIASGNVDTDGDGISDICDDDDDNDGILDINEGFVAPTELISNGDFSNGLTDWTVNNPTGGSAPIVGASDAVEFGYQTTGVTTSVSLDLNDLANDPGVSTQNGSIGTGTSGGPAQFHFNGTGDMYVAINPDAGGTDVGSFDTIDISWGTDWGLEAHVFSFGDISTLTPGNFDTGASTGLVIGYDNVTNDNLIIWNGVELFRQRYYTVPLSPTGMNLSVSTAGVVTFRAGGRTPIMTFQIPGTEWQDTNNSSWQFIASQTSVSISNNNDRIYNIEFNGNATEVFDNIGDSIEQSFMASTSDTATVSYEISTEGTGNASFTVLTEVLDDIGAVIATNNQVVSSGTNTVNFNFTPSTGNTSIRVSLLSASGDLATKQLLVDNISITQGAAIDTDNDGIFDHLDLDSDGDGCFDTVEAGHTDDDDNGQLGSSPLSVDAIGLVTGQGGYTGTTINVTVTSSPVTIDIQPAFEAAGIGGNATFTTSASGGAILSYQWQESSDSGTTWNDITNGGIYSGATTTSLTLTGVTNAEHENYYRAIITSSDNACEITTSGAASLFVLSNISVSDASVTEGGDLVFTITLSRALISDYEDLVISYTNISTSNDDYDRSLTVITIPANTTSMTFNVPTNDDNFLEATETFELELGFDGFPLNYADISDVIGIGTITDNDGNSPTEGISVNDFTVDESFGTADFVLTYTGSTVQDAFTVDFVVVDGTAISPEDYTIIAPSGNASFPANTTSGTTQVVTVTIIDDNLIEITENLNITLSNISNIAIPILDADGIGTITDNDGGGMTGVFFQNDDITVDEDAGTATVAVLLTGNIPGGFTIDYASTDDTGVAPGDYTANTGQLTFAGTDGETQPITISIIDDNLIEATERLFVNLSNASTSLIAINDDQATINIIDNDENIDIDSDNDGIIDVMEDLNLDGDDDPATDATNSDGDIYPDYLDIDSDNDGIPDNVEAQNTTGYIPPSLVDANNNGLDDAYESGTSLGLVPENTDGTDLPDFVDSDSDNDNIPDYIEGNDYDSDGNPDVVLIGSDKDNDGLDDSFEGTEQIDIDVNDEIDSPINDLPNTDGNDDLDYRDIDDDGDGIDTINEDTDGDDDYLNDDFDNDGTPDYLDPDQPMEYEDVEVFNVVTPNGDGVHDFLIITGLDVRPENDLQIYNRWGILVYTTNNYDTKNNVFDGTSQARSTIGKTDRLPAGTYFYLFNYVEVTEETISLSGYLYLN